MKNKKILNKAKFKINNKKIVFIGSLIGFVLIAIIVIAVLIFNRKYEVVFDNNNGTSVELLYVKYDKTITSENIKDKDDLGNLFIGWYEIIGEKDGNDILSDKPFDFKTKINKNIKLKAVYNEEIEKITISFDSREGSSVDSLTIEKGSSLVLPKNPTKKGYTFGNWETESEIPITDGANLSVSMTLYAVWKKNPIKDATKTYYCESGYDLNGTKCSKTETINGTLIREVCENNYAYNNDDSTCIAPTISSYSLGTCPAGTNYKMSGDIKCYSSRTQTDRYTCQNNLYGQYENGYCYTGDVKYITEYSCPNGYVMKFNPNAETDKRHECHAVAAPKKVYSCPDEYTQSDSKCIKTIEKDALVK